MPFGFEGLYCAVPEHHESVETLVKEAGMELETIEHLHAGGIWEVPIANNQPLPNLIHQALGKLAQNIPNFATRTHAIIFAHSVPIYGVLEQDFFATCIDGFNLEHIPRVVVSGQPCAITHQAVRLAIARLEQAPPDHGVLLLAGDVAYSADARLYFGAAMGDAALAGFLTRSVPEHQHQVIAAISQTHVFAWDGELSPPESIAAFRSVNPSYIRSAIEACLHAAKVTLNDIQFIVPHTPYIQIWDAVAPLLRIPRERILTDYIADTGHLNSNDTFIHYLRAHQAGRFRTGDLALLVNPGFGGSRGCTLLGVQHAAT